MKLVKRSGFGVACVASLLACAACAACSKKADRDGDLIREANDKSGAPADRVGTTTVTNALYAGITGDVAVARLVAARCGRETACNNVGPGKHYVDPDLCARDLSNRISMELKPSNCPFGVDASALENCIDAIRNESCTNAVETVERLATCRTSEMCKR